MTTMKTATITTAEYNELLLLTYAISDLPSTCDTAGPTREVGRRLSALVMSIRERNGIGEATDAPAATTDDLLENSDDATAPDVIDDIDLLEHQHEVDDLYADYGLTPDGERK